MKPDIAAATPLRIGISSCLLGNAVRYDAGHRHNAYITQTLGEYFEFVPFCPEMAIGLGVPRPPIRLVRVDGEVRVRGVSDPEQDVTAALVANGQSVAGQLAAVSGYIFKRGSPSCGMDGVRVYHAESGRPVETSAGMYARTLMQALPELPVEEEGRLMDARLRENFIERVFIYYRWQGCCATGMTPAALVDFHARHRFSVLARDEPVYRELGRLVAAAGKGAIAETAGEYIRRLMAALGKIATPKQHANVLMHITGFLKEDLARDEKAELLEAIEACRQQQVPLIVPLTLIRHHLRRHPNAYLSADYYLNPYPCELMLRNRI